VHRDDQPPPPSTRWLLILLAALLLAGVGICLYLTRFHDIEMYGDRSATLSNCPQTETTNCEVVNTSGYAELLGVPISALGVPTYLLLLIFTGLGWRRTRYLAYTFGIGVLLVAYSAFLYYVSTVKIGYLCAWCFRLYCINAATPALAALAAWRSPVFLLREIFAELAHPAARLGRAAALFAGLLVLTIGGERAYRSWVMESSSTSGGAAGLSEGPTSTSGTAPFRASSPVVRFSQQEGKVSLESFDLNAQLGKGKPLALIYWQPGIRGTEEGLVAFARFLKEKAAPVSAFAVVGGAPQERPEIAWESFCLLNLPADLPLLRDDGYALFRELSLTGMPSMALFDVRGVLISSHIQGLSQQVYAPGKELRAEDLILEVARGASPGTVPGVAPYYPSADLFGHCAPTFHLPELFTGKDQGFNARSSNGKPTLLMFWSSTCKHCQKEIPQLLKHVQEHPGEFNMVSVALIRRDEPGGFSHRKVTEAYVKTNGLPWLVLDDSSGFAQDLYRVTTTPTTFLIAPSGEIVGAWYHPHENLDSAMGPVLTRLAESGSQCTQLPAEPTKRASFSVTNSQGGTVSIDALASRPTVLHFWATWCAPCQAELPGLLKFRHEVERKGGQVVLVSVEDADAAARVQKYGSGLAANFNSFLAPTGGLAARLDLSYSVPRTYLLASGGEVLRMFRGAQPWTNPEFENSVLTQLQLPAR
jgi:thiol-disulfide isomerase/thioredoxin/uncharacterized membrane protein